MLLVTCFGMLWLLMKNVDIVSKATKSWFSVSQAPPHSFLDPASKNLSKNGAHIFCQIDLASDTVESFLIVARICYRFD